MDVARSARLPPSDPLPSQRALHREAQPAALVPQRLPWLLCHREAISRCLPGDSVLTSASQMEKVIQSRMRRYSTAGVLQIPVSRLPSLCVAVGFALQVANGNLPKSTAVLHSNRNIYTDFRKS